MNTHNNSRLILAGAIVLAAAMVCATLILVFSPMLWTDYYWTDKVGKEPVPSGCSIEAKPVVAGQTAMFVAHCPSWVAMQP